jgi:hypothetical protein
METDAPVRWARRTAAITAAAAAAHAVCNAEAALLVGVFRASLIVDGALSTPRQSHGLFLECTNTAGNPGVDFVCNVWLQTATSAMQGTAAAEAAAALAGPVADMAKAQEQARAREVCFLTNTKSQCSAALCYVFMPDLRCRLQAELVEMPVPEATLAASQHMMELFLAVRSMAIAAPQCQLSLQQYHVMLAAALDASPGRSGFDSKCKSTLCRFSA